MLITDVVLASRRVNFLVDHLTFLRVDVCFDAAFSELVAGFEVDPRRLVQSEHFSCLRIFKLRCNGEERIAFWWLLEVRIRLLQHPDVVVRRGGRPWETARLGHENILRREPVRSFVELVDVILAFEPVVVQIKIITPLGRRGQAAHGTTDAIVRKEVDRVPSFLIGVIQVNEDRLVRKLVAEFRIPEPPLGAFVKNFCSRLRIRKLGRHQQISQHFHL